MTETERTQERAHRGGGSDPVTEHRAGRARPERVDVFDEPPWDSRRVWLGHGNLSVVLA
jgi:hypothetical protein